MTEENRCPHCGSELPGNAPEGLCPRCLLQAGTDNDAPRTAHAPAIEGPGSQIGRYELLELIGEGGMGLVYLAEQKEPVRRKVALKIVKLGMDTMQVVARFRAEQQTLAMLDHPNIAQVFDAGTTESGRPYFVMEYVEGVPITKYCDRQKLSIDERLRLFVQVCAAIQHAHQKGVLHRDIKPSNILISANDHAPLPKIIDFGIAKAVHQPLTEQTSITEQGQLLGTPEYMSPEQADMAYSEVDTRSDVYSLGVVLYELLAGAPPFEGETLREAGIERIRQIIRDEEPRTPSARLTALGEQAKEVALMRRTQLLILARRLKKELEWIPLKAMRKEPDERYQSVSELAQDISNYLTGAALLAGPESRIYRTRKFIRKHAGAVAMVTLVVIAVLLGLVASIVMGCRAEQARKREGVARAQAQQQEHVAKRQADEYRRLLYIHQVALADASCRDGNIQRAHELLESCPEDLREWEWYYLNYIQDQSCMTFHGHDGMVYKVAISPDGKRIVSGSGDKTIRVWDANTGAELMSLHGHNNGVGAVFSPNGKRIISGSFDKTIKVWDAETGKEMMTLRGNENGVSSIGVSPDGERIAAGDTNGTIKLWDTSTGGELRGLRGHSGRVQSVAFSPDNTRIVSGSFDKTIKVWDVKTGNELMTLQGHNGRVWSVAYSPNGMCVVSGSSDKTIKLWDAETGSELKTLCGHELPIWSVAFSPDGTRIASGCNDGSIKAWDVKSGAELMTFRGHSARRIWSVVFAQDSRRIFSGCDDKTVKVWDLATERGRMTLRGGGAVFSPGGERIVGQGEDNTLIVWDVASGTEMTSLPGHDSYVSSQAFSPDGKRIVSGSADRTIKLWEAETGAELLTLRGHEAEVHCATFSPDGNTIASGSRDRTVKVWDVVSGKELMTLRGHDGRVWSVVFSPDGTRVASGSWDHTIKIWNLAERKEIMTLTAEQPVSCVAFSSHGKRIVSCYWDGTIRLWDLTSGEESRRMRGHSGAVWSVAVSPDGKRIVSGGDDHTVKLWDAATGAEVMTLRADIGRIFSVAFSPDGKTIAAGAETGFTTLWESTAPADGYELRRTGATAQELVNQLYKEQGLYASVTKALKADETLDEPVRKVGLQITNARLWQDEQAQGDPKQEQAEE